MHTTEANFNFVTELGQSKCDLRLGTAVHLRLQELGLETPYSEDHEYEPINSYDFIVKGIQDGLSALGLDMDDPSLNETPERYARMLIAELTIGLDYRRFPKCTTTPCSQMDQMVIVKDLSVISLCEHHLQTIEGVAHIAYIPDKKLLGLSKFARIVDFFSRRPQVQERLTEQVAASLQFILNTPNVAVVISAKHYCMRARGVLAHSSLTQTNKFTGAFLDKPAAREEFLNAIPSSTNR